MAAQVSIQNHCPYQNDTSRTDVTKQVGDKEGLRRVRKTRPRSSSSLVGCPGRPSQHRSTVTGQFRRCSSLSLSADLTDATSLAAAMEQSLKLVGDSFLVKSSLAPSTSKKAPTLPKQKKKIATTLKTRSMGCILPWRWSRMHKRIKRRKVVYLIKRKTNDRSEKRTVTKANCPQGRVCSALEASREKIDNMSQDSICVFSFNSAYQSKDDIHLNKSFSQKYQPKNFQDIAGHEITIKAISNAVEKKKIAPLYHFHGPSGTGKTSTARIFAMALNCESSTHIKPCWSCRGCSRSLYVMELCSGSRLAGFERIKTLLQSTSFTQAIPGFKVLIIEECHSFTAKAWDELLGILEGGYGSTVVYVLITSDANMVPKNISSRCQKFCFSKLKEEDITLKLEKIVAHEDIGIEREALKLIIAKAEGSLREAENILDQLVLLGSTITSSMVQQLVGLVPHNKLIDLLTTAISGDTIKTIRYTRELMATGVEPQALVSQLASLITDIFSGAAVADSSSSAGPSSNKGLLRGRSQLTNTQSERLCHALRILLETETELRSSTDQTSGIFSALVEITSKDSCNKISTGIFSPRKVTLPSGDKPNKNSEAIQGQGLSHSRSSTDHHSICRTSEQLDIDRIEPSTTTKSIDKTKRRRANAIVHLMFKSPEDKMAALICEESISMALKKAIGCPVTVNMSLEPAGLGIIEENTYYIKSQLVDRSHSKQWQRTSFLPEFIHSKNSEAETHCGIAQESIPPSENLRPMKLKDSRPSGENVGSPSEQKEATIARPQQIAPLLGLLTQKNQFDMSVNPERDIFTRGQTSIGTADMVTANNPKHRWLSLSSIPQSDASVEPYSQDILFENANRERESKARKNHKLQKGFSKATEDHHSKNSAMHAQLNRSWSCTDILCPRKTGKNHAARSLSLYPKFTKVRTCEKEFNLGQANLLLATEYVLTFLICLTYKMPMLGLHPRNEGKKDRQIALQKLDKI
ncbi:hypothetical protein F0562_036183 [Nyssa sinensis]|uniref:Uncharacterized protein n=1 Tax=Nyssa sinensis TaxID=561372 RepID=A0A5J5AF78_9ASTE|nr:hypothetical protein F0562_036183 [Nyssa sinensis]